MLRLGLFTDLNTCSLNLELHVPLVLFGVLLDWLS